MCEEAVADILELNARNLELQRQIDVFRDRENEVSHKKLLGIQKLLGDAEIARSAAEKKTDEANKHVMVLKNEIKRLNEQSVHDLETIAHLEQSLDEKDAKYVAAVSATDPQPWKRIPLRNTALVNGEDILKLFLDVHTEMLRRLVAL